MCRFIAYINSSLSVKASKLFKKLHNKEGKSTPAAACPYPEILIVGTCTTDEQHVHLRSRIDMIEKWVSKNCSDSAQQKCNTIIVNTSTNQAAAEIQARITKFISRDLVIPTPLSWELFRQIVSYLTKNIPILQIEKVATIATVCGITKADEFTSVLNFYHEHGAFLYFGDIEFLQNIVIFDPKWLQDKLCKISAAPPNELSQPKWRLLLKQGILVTPLYEAIWQSEELEGLPAGLVKLLEKYGLAAPIEIDEEISDIEGQKYFTPFALQPKKTFSPCPMSRELCTAPLHFIFPKTKYLPLGVFTYLNVALSRNSDFRIDFKSEMFSNQITYWYGNDYRDKVILSETLTSITVVVERVKSCGDQYKTSNFWLTCQGIFNSLSVELETVLKNSFEDVRVRAKPAFHCTCLWPEGLLHYVPIDLQTQSTCDTLRCDENKEYTLHANEQLWLKMAAPICDEGTLFKKEIDELLHSIKPEDHAKLAQVLEISYSHDDINFEILVNGWSQITGPDARRHLTFHLTRLGMDKAAFKINKGIFLLKQYFETERKSQGN